MANEGQTNTLTVDNADKTEPNCRGSECLFPGEKDERNVVRCLICYVVFHIECVSVSTRDKGKIWTCFHCRKLSARVQQLQSHVKELMESQSKTLEILTKINEGFEDERNKRKKAEEDLATVRSWLNELTTTANQARPVNQSPPAPLQEETTPQPHEETPRAPPTPNLLLGTSLLRNVDPALLGNWKVIAKRGATIEDLHKELVGFAENSINELVLVCGSIDAEKNSVPEVIDNYKAIVTTADSIAKRITIASVLPRTDKDLKEKIGAINTKLKTAAEDMNTNFIDNDQLFYSRSGAVNKFMLAKDGLHLAKSGVDSLLESCGVKLSGSAYTHVNYPNSNRNCETKVLFRGHTHPLSNFYPVEMKVGNEVFKSSEAAYQHRKAQTMGAEECARKIQKSDRGVTAMRLASKIKTDREWSTKKLSVMDSILMEKLRVCPNVRKALQNSGSKELVEDTPHEFWGRGRQGNGQNELGKLWMRLRTVLRENPDSLIQPKNTSAKTHHQSWATRGYQPRCYQCWETGHLQRHCHNDRRVVCWSCDRPSHKAKDCWMYQRQGFHRNGNS